MRRLLASTLILLLAACILTMVESVSASSIPKTSVPEFSLGYVDNSYDVPPEYAKDPYTGKSIIAQEGYHVRNRSIEITIKNQAFTPYQNENGHTGSLFYFVRTKGHFEEWPPYEPQTIITSYSEYPDGFVYVQNSDYTVTTHRVEDIAAGGEVDVQIKAVVGYRVVIEDQWVPGIPRGDFTTPPHHSEFTVFQESDWSNTQTITVNGLFFGTTTTAVLVVLIVALLAIVGTLIYGRKRKFITP